MQLQSSDDLGDEGILRERILSFLDRMKRDCNLEGIPEEDRQTAVFAIVAFIDESINASHWVHRESWLGNPLQLTLFDRMDAGEEFYVRLEQLRRGPDTNVHVLELYYICMTLGFRGRYQLRGKEKFQTIVDGTYDDLCRLTARRPDALSPNGQRSDEIVDVVTREVPLWVISVTAVAVGFFFYLVLTYLISSEAADVVRAINEVL